MALKRLNDFEIHVFFEKVWAIYQKINPEGEASSRKAIEVACKSGENHEHIYASVQIYYHESRGTDPQYRYQLGNFIRQKHYQDYIDSHTNLDHYLSRLEEKEKEAIQVIEAWNQACRPHWCPVADVSAKVAVSKRALSNEAFAKNWKEALKIAGGVFKSPLHSGDKRSYLTLSFRWFTDVGEKHTVLKLVEGEYGKFEEEIIQFRHVPSEEEVKKNQQEAMNAWSEIFEK